MLNYEQFQELVENPRRNNNYIPLTNITFDDDNVNEYTRIMHIHMCGNYANIINNNIVGIIYELKSIEEYNKWRSIDNEEYLYNKKAIEENRSLCYSGSNINIIYLDSNECITYTFIKKKDKYYEKEYFIYKLL